MTHKERIRKAADAMRGRGISVWMAVPVTPAAG